jgi:hypothetical protein
LTIVKGADIRNARAALALESGIFPNLAALAQPWNLPPPSNVLDLATNRTMISFDRDVVIASSDSVTIAAAWIIGFAAERDESGLNDPDLSELIVEGMLKADGYAGFEITFRSDRNSSPTDEAHWGGITFDLPANFQAGYGFYDCVEPQSVLDDVIFRDADYSIKLKGMCAPTLTDITFQQSKYGDIHIDGTDIVIPREYDLTGTPTVSTLGIWDLTGPASIVTTPKSASNYDAAFGADSLVDIIVQGRLITRPGTNAVIFGPGVTSADSAHWGGLYVDWHAEGTDIEGAKVGNARRGISGTNAVIFGPGVTSADSAHWGGLSSLPSRLRASREQRDLRL